MQVSLTVTAGPHVGRVFTFAEHDTFTVGRGEKARFQLKDKDLRFSRFHFLIEVNPPSCRLMDLGSRNGTYVNGKKVSSSDLQHGDEIKAGHTLLRLSVSEDEPSVEKNSNPDVEISPVRIVQPPGQAAPVLPVKAVPLPASPPPPVVADGPPAFIGCPVCGASPPSMIPTPILCTECESLVRAQPQPIPGYWLVRELGRGGMGIVALAVRQEDAQLVAIKTIKPAVACSKREVQRFLREANSLRELRHPNIVAFREMGQAEELLYLVMDYVKGTDAHQLVVKHTRLPIKAAVALICQMLDALAYAHGKGLVHRDLKPANILVSKENGRSVVRLADFGLARKYQASQLSGLTMAGTMGGTLAFMPPEQIHDFRNVRPAADQYAAAATLYMLLSGALVYDLPPKMEAQLAKLLQEDPVPLRKRQPEIPEELAAVVHRALSREPGDRFEDVTAFQRALRTAVPATR